MMAKAVSAFAGLLLLAACSDTYTPSGRSTTTGTASHFYGAAGSTFRTIDLDYSWKGIRRCSNRLPAFKVGSVPKGTRELVFELHNLTNSRNLHGGATVNYRGQTTVHASGHSYKGPCPAVDTHQRFKWVVTALDQYGDALASGSKTASFPEN